MWRGILEILGLILRKHNIAANSICFIRIYIGILEKNHIGLRVI